MKYNYLDYLKRFFNIFKYSVFLSILKYILIFELLYFIYFVLSYNEKLNR